jgi:hypothetical protein
LKRARKTPENFTASALVRLPIEEPPEYKKSVVVLAKMEGAERLKLCGVTEGN